MFSSQIASNFREGQAPGDVSSYDVEGDLSALQYTFVELDTTRPRCVKAFAGGFPIGVLANRPIEDATATAFSLIAQVQTRGKALVKAGSGGLAVGDKVKVTTGGVGIKATPTDGDLIVGQCEYAAAAGYIATVRLEKMYARVV